MTRLTAKDWLAIRDAWETDGRDGFAWVPKHLDLSVGRSAVAKRAAREGWVKQEVAEVVIANDVTPAVTPLSPSVTSVTSVIRGVGRPSGYRDEYAGMAYRLMLTGYTREGLAEVFGVDVRTIYRWQSVEPEFGQALWRGGAIADSQVAESLFNRANGSVVPDTHIALHEGQPVITSLEKHYPPDVGAARLWLTNRQPLLWRNKVEVVEEHNNTFPPTEELDALYEKALKQAEERQVALFGRRERLGLVLDGELTTNTDD